MAFRVKRTSFDFLATNYASKSPKIQILPEGFDRSHILAQPDDKRNFIERWYLSLQGEDAPNTSGSKVEPNFSAELAYRYDWVHSASQ